MPARAVDLRGQRFQRLVAIRDVGKDADRSRLWECLCDCGTTTHVGTANLRSNHAKSCGCLIADTAAALGYSMRRHGQCGTGAYRSWRNMLRRCSDPSVKNYAAYGARGIRVCDRWMMFDNFYADLGERPEGKTLDRLDNDKGYCKDNCRWATRREQDQNTRRKIAGVRATPR
jgi:hypothetical protein